MTGPRTIDVTLQVLDAEEALRIVQALEAVTSALWEAYGEEMSERLIDKYRATTPGPEMNGQFDFPF